MRYITTALADYLLIKYVYYSQQLKRTEIDDLLSIWRRRYSEYEKTAVSDPDTKEVLDVLGPEMQQRIAEVGQIRELLPPN